jgi:hypothetical protein
MPHDGRVGLIVHDHGDPVFATGVLKQRRRDDKTTRREDEETKTQELVPPSLQEVDPENTPHLERCILMTQQSVDSSRSDKHNSRGAPRSEIITRREGTTGSRASPEAL